MGLFDVLMLLEDSALMLARRGEVVCLSPWIGGSHWLRIRRGAVLEPRYFHQSVTLHKLRSRNQLLVRDIGLLRMHPVANSLYFCNRGTQRDRMLRGV